MYFGISKVRDQMDIEEIFDETKKYRKRKLEVRTVGKDDNVGDNPSPKPTPVLFPSLRTMINSTKSLVSKLSTSVQDFLGTAKSQAGIISTFFSYATVLGFRQAWKDIFGKRKRENKKRKKALNKK